MTKAAAEGGNLEIIEEAYSSAVSAAKEKQNKAEAAINPQLLELAMDMTFPLIHVSLSHFAFKGIKLIIFTSSTHISSITPVSLPIPPSAPSPLGKSFL